VLALHDILERIAVMSISPISRDASVGNHQIVANSVIKPLAEVNSGNFSDLQVKSSTSAVYEGNDHSHKVDVENAVKTLNDFTEMVAQNIKFSMDEESGKIIVKVVDTKTQEILRQFPSVEALSIARSIDKMQGLLIHEKV